MDPKPQFVNFSSYDIIELFAGRARITRMAQGAGYSAIAADQAYDEHEFSSLHLCGNAGFVWLAQIIFYVNHRLRVMYIRN